MRRNRDRTRILKVLELLKTLSDENHPLSAADISAALEKDGTPVERKTVYEDINALCDFGYHIARVYRPRRGYYFASREFEPPEICLLIDAVQSAGFVPGEQTRRLVKKLEGLVSRSEAEEIRGRICIENRSKCSNEAVYGVITVLNDAIYLRRKVRLRYRRSVLQGNRIGAVYKDMTISPYALLWDSDHYYLIGNNEKYDNLIHLRVDRIENITITTDAARHFSEVSEYRQRFDTADYARKAFNMFGGELCRIDLECKLELLDQITDKFGSERFIRRYEGEDVFRFSADALISEGLIGWIMQFGGDIKVLSPKTLKNSVAERAERLLNAEKQ